MRSVRFLVVCSAVLLLGGSVICPAHAQGLPAVETFESRPEGYLDAQGDWSGLPEARVQVQTATVHGGSKAGVVATNSIATLSTADTSATNVWIDFHFRTQPRAVGRIPSLSPDAVAGFYINGSGAVVARSNATWVTLPAFSVADDAWYRFSVNLDYTARRWALYVADNTPNKLATPLATNLAFTASATNTYFHAFRIKN